MHQPCYDALEPTELPHHVAFVENRGVIVYPPNFGFLFTVYVLGLSTRNTVLVRNKRSSSAQEKFFKKQKAKTKKILRNNRKDERRETIDMNQLNLQKT